MRYALELADHGLDALKRDSGLMAGLNIHAGRVVNAPVAESLGLSVERQPELMTG